MDSTENTAPTDTPETRTIAEFLARQFPDFTSFDQDIEIEEDEAAVIDSILSYVDSRFARMKYILGLALDFTILAQRLSQVDEDAKEKRMDLGEDQLFERYELVTTRAGVKANTLTLKFGDAQEGIRRIEESVVDLFHQLKRPNYPSAYVYNTGQWQKYKDLLVYCFQLSEPARLELCKKLIRFGLSRLSVADFYGRAIPRVFLFHEIIESYEREGEGENAGLTLQALASGFFEADRPHLSIVTDKVRRGSKRQKMIGDIDCYSGIDLELSIEVKDLEITKDNLISELGEFIQNIADSKAPGLAFVVSMDKETSAQLEKQGIRVMTEQELLSIVRLWDWPKQNNAVLGMLHYLSHIEQNPDAVQRLLAFIHEKDPDHDALVYFSEEKES